MQIKPEEDSSWDCLESKFNLKLDEISNAAADGASSKFDVTDKYMRDLGSMILEDTDRDEKDPSKGWIVNTLKSSKTCEPGTEEGKISCSKIRVHFYRFFETNGGDQDIQLTPEDYS